MIAACSVTVLLLYGRTIGGAAVAGVTLLEVLAIVVYRRTYDRLQVGRGEAVAGWLLWCGLIVAATMFYVLDWRMLGAGTLALVLCILFIDFYICGMRPDLVDRWVREGQGTGGERGTPDDDDPYR